MNRHAPQSEISKEVETRCQILIQPIPPLLITENIFLSESYAQVGEKFAIAKLFIELTLK